MFNCLAISNLIKCFYIVILMKEFILLITCSVNVCLVFAFIFKCHWLLVVSSIMFWWERKWVNRMQTLLSKLHGKLNCNHSSILNSSSLTSVHSLYLADVERVSKLYPLIADQIISNQFEILWSPMFGIRVLKMVCRKISATI